MSFFNPAPSWLPAGGRILLLERSWVIGRRWDEETLREAIVRCDNPNLWTSLLSADGNDLLFVMNFFTGALCASISYRSPFTGNWVDTGAHTLPGVCVKVVS